MDAALYQTNTQQNDNKRQQQSRQIVKERVQVDIERPMKERKHKGVKQDVKPHSNQQNAAEKVSAPEEVDYIDSQRRVQMEQKVIVRKVFVAHRTKV